MPPAALGETLSGPETQTSGQNRVAVRSLRFPHVASLDGVRGLASIAVMMHHCFFTDVPVIAWPMAVAVLQHVCAYFSLGVDLFFVLSGYLITNLLLLARRKPDYYRDFYWKRAFRILPALLLVLTLTHLTGQTSWLGIVLALLFLANIINFWGLPEIGPFWSLAIEEQFYLLWPTAVHRSRPRTMFRILLAVMIVPAVLRTVSVALHHGRTHYTFVHCDGLAWGAMLAFIAFRARIPWQTGNALRLWKQIGRWLVLAGVCGMVADVFLTRHHHLDYGLLLTAAAPLFTGLLTFLLTHRRSLPARFLGTSPLRYLGNISYMVYLSHAYFLDFYDKHVASWKFHPDPQGLFLRFLFVFVVTLLWSTLTLYCFERPIGRLRRYFLRPG